MNFNAIAPDDEIDDELDNFLVWLGQAIENMDTDGTYILNPAKYNQMNKAVKLAQALCVDWGSVEVKALDAKELHGYFSLTMPILHLYDESMKTFRQLAAMVDVMAFYPGSEPEILVEFVINGLFVKVEE